MGHTHNRIIAATLSALMIGQVALFGDGTTQGILHPETIAYAGKTASNGIKYYLSQTTKDSIKTATSFGNIKALIKSTAPSWKDSIATLFRKKD